MAMIIRTNGRVCSVRYTDERPYIVTILYGRKVLKNFMFRILPCMIIVHVTKYSTRGRRGRLRLRQRLDWIDTLC